MEFQVWEGRPQIVRSREMIIEDLMADIDYPDKGTETEEERAQIRKDYEALSEDNLKHEWLLRFG
jgi:hypothetical protein